MMSAIYSSFALTFVSNEKWIFVRDLWSLHLGMLSRLGFCEEIFMGLEEIIFGYFFKVIALYFKEIYQLNRETSINPKAHLKI